MRIRSLLDALLLLRDAQLAMTTTLNQAEMDGLNMRMPSQPHEPAATPVNMKLVSALGYSQHITFGSARLD